MWKGNNKTRWDPRAKACAGERLSARRSACGAGGPGQSAALTLEQLREPHRPRPGARSELLHGGELEVSCAANPEIGLEGSITLVC